MAVGDVFVLDEISIHAPSRERLSYNYLKAHGVPISIHAPSRERRSYYYIYSRYTFYFNPRSLAGATLSTVIPA